MTNGEQQPLFEELEPAAKSDPEPGDCWDDLNRYLGKLDNLPSALAIDAVPFEIHLCVGGEMWVFKLRGRYERAAE